MVDVVDIVANSTCVHALIFLSNVMHKLQARPVTKATKEYGQIIATSRILVIRSLCEYNNDLFRRYCI